MKNKVDLIYKMGGDLSLHGVTKSIDFDIDTNGAKLEAMITLHQKGYDWCIKDKK